MDCAPHIVRRVGVSHFAGYAARHNYADLVHQGVDGLASIRRSVRRGVATRGSVDLIGAGAEQMERSGRKLSKSVTQALLLQESRWSGLLLGLPMAEPG